MNINKVCAGFVNPVNKDMVDLIEDYVGVDKGIIRWS